MNRRKFLAFLAAGGVVTATGLWMPGQKLISIPKRPVTVSRYLHELWSKDILRMWIDSRYEQLIMQGYTFVGDTLVRNKQTPYYGPTVQSLLSDNVTKT